MLEEEILLLIKENRHYEALQRYVNIEEFGKAEEFCVSKDKSLGLMTTLLKIYFEKYDNLNKEYEDLKSQTKISESLKAKQKAETFRE